MKGASYVPGWSISLDFVPHVTSKGKIGWHRSLKQYRADLSIDPFDDPERLRVDRLKVSGMRRVDEVRRSFDRSAALAIDLAGAWFDRITDASSLIPLFEEDERRPVVRFGWDNYPQCRLAYAFVLASVGEIARAHAQLDLWRECLSDVYGPPADQRESLTAQLHTLLDEAPDVQPWD